MDLACDGAALVEKRVDGLVDFVIDEQRCVVTAGAAHGHGDASQAGRSVEGRDIRRQGGAAFVVTTPSILKSNSNRAIVAPMAEFAKSRTIAATGTRRPMALTICLRRPCRA